MAYRKTGLHGILFISTVDLPQPPRATVDLLQPPRAPVHPASTARYSTGYCSTTPPPSTVHPALHTTGSCSTTLHGHPSTVYCSSSPPRGRPVHPTLPGVVFIQPEPARSIGVLFIQRQRHRVLFIHPTAHCSSTPYNAHCSSRGSIDLLQLAAVAKESLDRVQLTAIDRSLGFSNA